MKRSSKTEITTENVDALVDQYADTWAFARDIEEMFADCSTKSIGYWRDLGKLRSREVERKQRQPWVQWNVADVIVAVLLVATDANVLLAEQAKEVVLLAEKNKLEQIVLF